MFLYVTYTTDISLGGAPYSPEGQRTTVLQLYWPFKMCIHVMVYTEARTALQSDLLKDSGSCVYQTL